MTKKPSEKNKAWEKDRRDRLNKTFDELAKLLPKYDPSVVWSKIEIIQKAITFITDLRKKREDYLKAKNSELFKEYEDFVDCLKYYQERHAQLTELLKKAKVPLPTVVLPQLLVKKPELLSNTADSETTISLQKPKKPRTRSKKNDADTKKTERSKVEGGKSSKKKRTEEVIAPSSPKSSSVEVAIKPTAIITAFSREETSVPVQSQSQSQSPPLVPAKPVMVRVRRATKNNRRLKRVPKTSIRMRFMHPDKILTWNTDGKVGNQKSKPAPRRAAKKKRLPKEKPSKRGKLELPEEPIREQSVSPTAAFLLSFPVVTSSMLSGRNVENTDNSESLENLNNFFATEEYSKFCDQNPAPEEKASMPLCASMAIENDVKSLTNGKSMTCFTVSAITRPNSPKKSNAHCEQEVNKTPWIVESSKLVNSLPAKSFDDCSSFGNINPMIGNTVMCSSTHQVSSGQLPSKNVSLQGVEHRTSARIALAKSGKCLSSCTESTFPTVTVTMSNAPKSAIESSVKTHPHHTAAQRNSAHPTTNWALKSAPPNTSLTSIPRSIDGFTSKSSINSSTVPTKTSGSSEAKLPSITTADTTAKPISKLLATSYFSPTKSFFYDYPAQSQHICIASTALISSSDPLISSTTKTSKSFSFGLPSIKTEIPWLQASTTAATPSKSTTTTSTCNLNTNFTSFDLASIVCEPTTSTSFTFSQSTSKSSGPATVETGNKQNVSNLFLPYEEVQYTPTFTFSLTKPTDSHVYSSSWKSDKPKDISDQIFYDCEQSKPQQKSHVNWMTSPAPDYATTPATLPLAPIDFGNQFPTASNFDFTFGCRKDSYDDENQFMNWSPTKPTVTEFSTAYSFENFGSNEAPPNKTVKQIFSVSQLVDQTPSQESSNLKKSLPKSPPKSTPVKQTFSNTYSAESLIAKKDNRLTNTTSFYNSDALNTQSDYHNSSNYFYNYPNTQSCLQPEQDYLGAAGSSCSASATVKSTSILPPPESAAVPPASVLPPFDSTTAPSTTNYFAHSISSIANDPYDPTYFPSSNYNHATTSNWNHASTKGSTTNPYNQSQLPSAAVYGGTVEPSTNVSSNLTNFNLSSICPEIDDKDGSNGW